MVATMALVVVLGVALVAHLVMLLGKVPILLYVKIVTAAVIWGD